MDETLIFTVGQSQLPETPSFNIVYTDPDFTVYLITIGHGELSVHIDLKSIITKRIFKRMQEVFGYLCAGLEDRGLDHIDTWVFAEDDRTIHLATLFGFEETGFMKIVEMTNGEDRLMVEMRYTFPFVDEIN